jgi:hypothetical protein
MVSSHVVNDMPVDKVTAFSKSTDKIFFWVFYEHFTVGDTISMKMVYTPTSQTVLSSTQPTGGEYGAATGSVSAPSGGWPVGAYQITFSGRGVTKTVDFTVIDGATTTVPLPYAGAGTGYAKAARTLGPEGTIIASTPVVIKDAGMQSNSNDAVNEANDVLSRGTLRRAPNSTGAENPSESGANSAFTNLEASSAAPSVTQGTCIPDPNMNIAIYQVDATGHGTQIAQATTDANGVFSFTVSSAQKSASSMTYSFGFYPSSGGVGLIKEDGLKTDAVHTVSSATGPGYSYTLCHIYGEVKTQTKGAFAVSGKSDS